MHFANEEYLELESERFGKTRFFHSFASNFRTYVDGKNPYKPTIDIDKGNPLGKEASKYFSVTKDDGVDGGIDAVIRVLSLVLDPSNQPVLFHCLGGRHRTGMIAMSIRYMQGGFWVDGPKKKHWGKKFNPAQEEYYNYAGFLWRKENLKFIEKFSQDGRFLEFKKKYSPLLQEE